MIVVVTTTYHNDKWSYKAVNFLKWDIKWGIHKRTQQGASSQLVSYLYKISWSVLPIVNSALMSYSRPPCVLHVSWRHLPDLPSYSRLVTSHHVTCHVTSLSCISSSLFKKKKKKSKIEKIKEKKIKIVNVQSIP